MMRDKPQSHREQLRLRGRVRGLVGVLVLMVLTVACGAPLVPDGTPTPAVIVPTRTATPMPLCTPPPCRENESSHCPGECPGGCGTTCATHTPSADGVLPPVDAPQLETPIAESPLTVAEFPDPSLFEWRPLVDGLSSPVGIAHAGDGSHRLFVIEQRGTIRIIQAGVLLPEPFLDIQGRVVDRGNEQGLLGLAFHPHYAANGRFFVNYTGSGGDTVISRFQVSTDPNLADPESEAVLIRIPQPYGNHNGGHLAFGPDGLLYIGTGDGGSAGDPEGNAQNPFSLLGKMLRLDVDYSQPYAIPAGNPYVNGGGLLEIWALGLRNPWRYSFDRLTGELFIGDVGQNLWEEIDYLPPSHSGGANFGWDFWEGSHPFEGDPPESLLPVFPIWEYDHASGCSVTGGVVYRGAFPAWNGVYLYGDFCSGLIWGLLRDQAGAWQNQLLFETGAQITTFGEDEAGEVYFADRRGTVFKLVKSP